MTTTGKLPRAIPRPVEELSAQEVARKIHVRLRRLEADREWNRDDWTDAQGVKRTGVRLFNAGASVVGANIRLTFVSYQGGVVVDVDQARDYLVWLRAGNRGSFYRAEHEGAVRRSKTQRAREADAEGRVVAYSHGWTTRGEDVVYSAVHVPEELPKGAETAAAASLTPGDRVFLDGRWRRVTARTEYIPPEPEAVDVLMEEMRKARMLGRYDVVEDLARSMEWNARQLRQGRDFEERVRLAGGGYVQLTPETVVAVKRAKERRA